MTLHAVSHSLRYDATARPGNSASAARRSGAGFSAVARTARARSRHAVLRSTADGCPLRSLPLVAGAFHRKRATAYAGAPKALVTPAGYMRRRRDRGATPEFWVKGLPPKNGANGSAAKTDALPQERKQAQENHYE
jgi:hypothetical protein